MRYEPEILAQALYLMTKDRSEAETTRVIGRFLTYVTTRFGPLAPARVLERLPAAVKKADGIEDVLLESARKLPAATIRKILDDLGIDAAKAEVTTRINAGLIGGVRVRRRDSVFDASIKNKLSELGKLPANLRAEA